MSDEELEEKISEVCESSGLDNRTIVNVLAALEDEFQMIVDEEES